MEAVQTDTAHAVELTDSILNKIVASVTQSSTLVAEVNASTQEHSVGAKRVLNTTSAMQYATQQLATAAKEQADVARGIMRSVELMNEMTRQVAESTGEQKRGGDMVVRAMEQIANVAQQNLSSADQLSKTTLLLVQESVELKQMSSAFAV